MSGSKGNITKRGKESWRLKFDLGRDPETGKRRIRYETVRGTKRQAQDRLTNILAEISKDEHVDRSMLTLGEWVDTWIALRASKVNARTIERYAQLLRLHVVPTLGTRRLQEIKPKEIDSLYAALSQRLSPRTVHHVHTVLGACFATAVRKGEVRSSPVANADAPAPGDDEAGQVLDQEQLAALLQGFRGSVLFPIVNVAAFTGARRNEILALRWSDIDFSAKSIRIWRALEETQAHGVRYKEPKTERGKRTITIDDGLVDLLRAEHEKLLRCVTGLAPEGNGNVVDIATAWRRLPDDALVFPSPPAAGAAFDPAKPRNPRSVTKQFCEKARKLGFAKLRFHDLRGTHETLLLDAGVPVHVVAARCGHDPAVLLRVYAKRTKKADTSAAAVIGALSKAVLGAVK